MIQAGFDPQEAHRVWLKMNRWQSVMRRPVRFVMNLQWFRERGLVFLHDRCGPRNLNKEISGYAPQKVGMMMATMKGAYDEEPTSSETLTGV